TGTTGVVLANEDVLEESLVVKNSDGSVTYELDTDYTYDDATRTVARVDTGGIASGNTVSVTYGTTFFKVLDSVPVLVEKKLTLDSPDREIPSENYTVTDYVNGKVKLNVDPPADAMYLMLDFTQRNSVY